MTKDEFIAETVKTIKAVGSSAAYGSVFTINAEGMKAVGDKLWEASTGERPSVDLSPALLTKAMLKTRGKFDSVQDEAARLCELLKN